MDDNKTNASPNPSTAPFPRHLVKGVKLRAAELAKVMESIAAKPTRAALIKAGSTINALAWIISGLQREVAYRAS